MLRATTLFTIFTVFVQFAFAQITITSTDILNLIGATQVIEYDSSYSISINVGSAGENRSWDFSAYPTTTEQNLSILAPQGTVFADSFPEANFVLFYDLSQADTTYNLYSYANISSNVFLNLGEGTIINIPNEYDSSYVNFDQDETPLPLSYGLEWTASTSDTTGQEGFMTIKTTNSNYSVDAWGTVTIPAGTFDCLRLREDYSTTTIFIVGDTEFPIDTTIGINYTWFSKDNFLICDISSQDGETNPEFSDASYFSRLKSTTTAISSELRSGIVQKFALEQNFPNPFNPVTSISYMIGKADHVSLSIYDSAGRLVQTLFNEYQNAGLHSIQWNAANLASGIYYYRLQIAGFSEIKKAVLLK